MARASSLDLLAHAIPQPIIAMLDPQSKVPSAELREALAVIVAALLWVVALRVLSGVLLGLRDLLAGRRMVVAPGGFFSFIRKLSLVGVVALPVYGLMEQLDGAGIAAGYKDGAILAGVLWVVLRACVRDVVWLDPDERMIRIRSGFAIFAVTEVSIDLSEVLLDATLRAPVGKQATGRPVYVLRPVLDQLTEHLGDKDEALQWLRQAVGRCGLVPAGRRFVAGAAAN